MPRPPTQRIGAVALCLACLVAACAGSDEASDTTPPAPVTTPAPATTATTVVETTTTTTPPTTAAPTTTIDQAELAAAVEQAYFAAHAAFQAAIQDPTDDELRSALEQLFTGANLEQAVETLDSMEANGVVARPHPVEASQAIVLAEPVISPTDPTIADIVVCEQNSERFYDTDEPTVDDVLIRDEVIIGRSRIRFVAIDGQWKSSSGEVLARLGSFDQCVPS